MSSSPPPPSTDEKGISAVKGGFGPSSESATAVGVDTDRYIEGKRFGLVYVGLLCSVFLVALDNTIVSTAIPQVVSQFNGLDQVTWVVTAYFLTQVGFTLTGGQLLTVVPSKIMFLASILLFEIGSLICGLAQSMEVLIFGRAFAGVGAGCIMITVFAIISEVKKLEDRPAFLGGIGAVFALSSVVGPLLGGAFTDKATWRWCFFINLPFGGLAAAVVIFFLPYRQPRVRPGTVPLSKLQKWASVDWIGALLCLGLVTALLLPLQWGGQTKPWDDPTVIACFCVFGVVTILFVLWQYHRGDNALLPLALLRNRTLVGCVFEAFFIFLGLMLGTYYLPLWFQAQGHSATRSGIDLIPLQLATVLTVMISGGVANGTGRYWPWLVATPLLISVGSGLLYTIDENTSNARLIGYQIIVGIGIGGALQNTIVAIQAEFSGPDREHLIPQTTATIGWSQLLGGIVGLAIAGTVFANGLSKFLPADLDHSVRVAVRQSVNAVRELPLGQKELVVKAYIQSINQAFLLGVPAGILASLSALLIRNYDLKKIGGVVPNDGSEV